MTHRKERAGHLEAHDIVRPDFKFWECVHWSQRNGCNYLRGMHLGKYLKGDLHGRSRRDTVIYQHDGGPFDIEWPQPAAVEVLALRQGDVLATLGSVDLILRDADPRNEITVENAVTANRDGTHRQLFVPWYTQFADVEHVKGRIEHLRNFSRDGDTPAW